MMGTPEFGSCGFGWLVANGRRYDRDLVVTADGELIDRPKHLSKKYGGWHTVLGPEEVEHALAGNPDVLLVATGHFGVLPIQPATLALLESRGIPLVRARISRALERYRLLSGEGKRVAAILHLTC